MLLSDGVRFGCLREVKWGKNETKYKGWEVERIKEAETKSLWRRGSHSSGKGPVI